MIYTAVYQHQTIIYNSRFMQVIEDLETFKAKLESYDCTISLAAENLRLQLINDATYCKYTADINDEFLKINKNFQFFFSSIAELYHYLTTSFSQITITKNGTLVFNLYMNVGSKLKNFECQIKTAKQEMPEEEAYLIKCNKMQNEIDSLKQEIAKLKKAFQEQEEKQNSMSLKMAQYQKIINGKDQIINTIFHELRQIKEWKEEHQKLPEDQVAQKTKFTSDLSNPHSKKFVQIANKYKKITGGSWDVLINKIPIDKNETTKYHIRQIRAGNNGSFMYGIGSEFIKGINRAQDSKQFIGYYENTGNVYQQGQSKKGGPRIKDGQIVTISIDPKKWKVYWYINGKKEAQANIGVDLRSKSLYLALVVFNDESQIQFFD